MSVRFYDEAIYKKIQNWIVDPNMRILKPDETTRLFQVQADLNNDNPIRLPLIAISRDRSIDFTVSTKRNLTYDGLKIEYSNDKSAQLNAIPFTTNYQLDIYTSKYEEGDEYLREFVFQLINNPKLEIEIPYNGVNISHVANLRLVPSAEDNSDIPERLFTGQFTRWTLTLELQDAYMFNAPVKNNWKIVGDANTSLELEEVLKPDLDYDEELQSSHDGFTHIAEKESN